MVCYRQQLTVWPGKSILCKRNTLISAILVNMNLGYPTLEGPGRQMVVTSSTSGHPWKLWGITVQNSYMEGRWQQNWAHTSPLYFFPSGHGNSRKSDFLGKTLCTLKFSTGIFFGATTHGILTHSGFRKCSRSGWPSLRFEAAQSEVIGQKLEVLQKIRGVTKN